MTCLASTDRLPVGEDRYGKTHYTCGLPENDEGTCARGHRWSAIAAFKRLAHRSGRTSGVIVDGST